MPDLAAAISQELGRQREEIELIASENIVSRAVLEAQGSVMTNKYAEGLPGSALLRRVPVRRHRRRTSRSTAQSSSSAAASPMCSPIPAARRTRGLYRPPPARRHDPRYEPPTPAATLTHGAKPNQSGKWFNAGAVRGAREDLLPRLRTDRGPGRRASPEDDHSPAGSAIPRILDFAKFREIADSVAPGLLVDMAHFAGLVAAGLYPLALPPHAQCRDNHDPQDPAPARAAA